MVYWLKEGVTRSRDENYLLHHSLLELEVLGPSGEEMDGSQLEAMVELHQA